MAITVQCSCGKRTGVSDALAGKTIKCSGCGDAVFVSPAAPSPTKSSAKSPAKPSSNSPTQSFTKSGRNQFQNQTSSIYISKGKIVFLSVLAGIALLVLIAMVGPIRVYNQWQAREPKAGSDVCDVITFGLQAYLSQTGAYDPKFQHQVPAVNDPCVFIEPILCFTMPEKLVFRGKSNQGNFMGTYNTRTGDIDADVYYGGYSVAGMLDIAKPTGNFHMTGRMQSGFPQAEFNGQSLQIIRPSDQ